MENKIKCFSDEHKEMDANSFCPKCRIYMCNKCENIHSSFFKNHIFYKLTEENEIFTGLCKEENHLNKLEYYCKTHNELCCGLCIVKFNKKGEGQHKDCDVCYIEKIKEEKKNKLKENIEYIENLENKLNENLEELKEIFEKMEKDKNELKSKIKNVFQKMKYTLNTREEKLLSELDNIYNSKFYNEEISEILQTLPKQIKLSLEKRNLLDKEWDNDNLSLYINDCINIEKNIKNINIDIINENIEKYKNNYKEKIDFIPEEESLIKFIDKLNAFGKIYSNTFRFRNCPEKLLSFNRGYTLSGRNRNIITKIGITEWLGTICENELDKSIEEHKWKIKILNTFKKFIYVGVAPIDFNMQKSNFYSCGWYLFCSNSTLYSGLPFKYNGKKTELSKVDDEIIVVMNIKKRSLKFIINNEDKGDSYIDIPIDKPIYPAVVLFHTNDKVKISEIL